MDSVQFNRLKNTSNLILSTDSMGKLKLVPNSGLDSTAVRTLNISRTSDSLGIKFTDLLGHTKTIKFLGTTVGSSLYQPIGSYLLPTDTIGKFPRLSAGTNFSITGTFPNLVLNSLQVPPSNIALQYKNGFNNSVNLNTDSIAVGNINKFSQFKGIKSLLDPNIYYNAGTMVVGRGQDINNPYYTPHAKLEIFSGAGKEQISILPNEISGEQTRYTTTGQSFNYPALTYHAGLNNDYTKSTSEIAFVDRPGTINFSDAARTSDIQFRTARNWNGIVINQYMDTTLSISANNYGGSVGIRTTKPLAALHVNGDLIFNTGSQSAGKVLVALDSTGRTDWQNIATGTGTGGGSVMNVTANAPLSITGGSTVTPTINIDTISATGLQTKFRTDTASSGVYSLLASKLSITNAAGTYQPLLVSGGNIQSINGTTLTTVGNRQLLVPSDTTFLDNQVLNNTAAITGKENSLGSPATNGYFLSSTTTGVRSWATAATSNMFSTKILNTTANIQSLSIVDSTKQLYVTDTIQGGTFNQYFGGDLTDTAIVYQDVLGRKWKRNMPNGALDIRWFGAQIKPFDSYNAIMKAINYHLAHPGTYVYIPNVVGNAFYSSQTLNLTGKIIIRGEKSAIFFPTSTLQFPPNKKGIVFTVGFLTMSDLDITHPGFSFSDSTAHTIELHGTGVFDNVTLANASGNNLHIDACAATGTMADQSTFNNCGFRSSLNNGVYITGCDANIILFTNCVSSDNYHWGFYDNGFLGNTYIQAHGENNGNNLDVIVTYNGHGYAARNTIGVDNVNQKPDVTLSQYWVLSEGYGARNAWDSTKKYYSGGTYAGTNPNAKNLYNNCYSEPYQPPSMFSTRSLNLLGLNGSGQSSGASLDVFAGNTVIGGSLYVNGDLARASGIIASNNAIKTPNFYSTDPRGGLWFLDNVSQNGTGMSGDSTGLTMWAGGGKRLFIEKTTGNTLLSNNAYFPSTERLTVDGNLALFGKLRLNYNFGNAGQALLSGGTSGSNSWSNLDSTTIPALIGIRVNTNAITANTTSITANTTAISGKENSLSNPATNGYILSSTTTGTRSWIAPATGGAITLTTNGNSGPSTLVGSVLNTPTYISSTGVASYSHPAGTTGTPTTGSLGGNVTGIVVTGNDAFMKVAITTSGVVSGTIGTINYALGWSASPSCVISASNQSSAGTAIIANGSSATSLIIAGVLPSAAGTYTYTIFSGL